MDTARQLAAAVLLLLCCTACEHKSGPQSATAYLDPKNIALRKQARECSAWSARMDFEKAFDLYSQAGQNGDVLARLAASMVRWIDLDDDSYIKSEWVQQKVLPAVRKLADQGSAEAQFLYGWYGVSAREEGSKGVEYLEQAARNGYTEALAYVGYAKQDGRLTEKDMDAAADWFLKASQAGDGQGSYALGHLLADTKYPRHDFEKSFQFYLKSREQGCLHSFYALGFSAQTGLGTRVDEKAAAAYFQEGIDRGDGDCYYGLGRLYVEGEGMKDYAKARKLLEEAVARHADGATEMLKYLDSLEQQ